MGQAGEGHRDESRLNEELQIIKVVHDWALWRDAGDWERFLTVWHDNGWMTATWFQGPAEEFIKRMTDLGYNIIPGTPEDMAKMLDTELKRWGPIVKASGAKVD